MQQKEVNDGKTRSNTHRAQLTRLILKLEREEHGLIEPEPLVATDAPPQISAENNHGTNSWRTIFYGALALSFVLLLALTWMRRDFKPAEVPQWKPVFALAEAAREKGELYDAKGLYSQAGRFAAWRDDWAGILAAACGLDKLEKKPSRYSARDALLLRAVTAAEKTESRTGITAVAKAFTLLGKHQSASMVLSRVRKNWATENNESADVVLSDCWTGAPDQTIDGGRRLK